jgi:hypothetical protein
MTQVLSAVNFIWGCRFIHSRINIEQPNPHSVSLVGAPYRGGTPFLSREVPSRGPSAVDPNLASPDSPPNGRDRPVGLICRGPNAAADGGADGGPPGNRCDGTSLPTRGSRKRSPPPSGSTAVASAGSWTSSHARTGGAMWPASSPPYSAPLGSLLALGAYSVRYFVTLLVARFLMCVRFSIKGRNGDL